MHGNVASCLQPGARCCYLADVMSGNPGPASPVAIPVPIPYIWRFTNGACWHEIVVSLESTFYRSMIRDSFNDGEYIRQTKYLYFNKQYTRTSECRIAYGFRKLNYVEFVRGRGNRQRYSPLPCFGGEDRLIERLYWCIRTTRLFLTSKYWSGKRSLVLYNAMRTWSGKIQRRSWRGVKNRLVSLTLGWHCLDLRREEGRVSSRAPLLRLLRARIPVFTTKAIPFFFYLRESRVLSFPFKLYAAARDR